MDLFGIFVLSAATAVGGGIVRDILIGNIPPAAFKNSIYLWIILGSIVIVTLTVRYFNIHMWRRFMGHLSAIYLLCDAIGLGSFTVTGTLLGCYYYPDYWILDITLGVLTAVGGGVIRDVLAGRIPVVLRTEVYATASLLGSVLLYGAVIPFEVPFEVGAIVSFRLQLPSGWLPFASTSMCPASAVRSKVLLFRGQMCYNKKYLFFLTIGG